MTLNQLKVLVLIVGINRCFDLVWPSIRSFLVEPMLRGRGLDIQVTACIAQGAELNNPRSSEVGQLRESVPDDPLLSDIALCSLDQIRSDTRIVADFMSDKPDTWSDGHKSIENLISTFRLYAQAKELIAEDIEVVVFARPDVLWIREFRSLLFLRLARWVTFFPSWGRFDGLNDRFAIMSRKQALRFLSQEDFVVPYVEKHGSLHAEKIVREIFLNSFVSNSMRPKFVRMRLGGYVELRDFNQVREVISVPWLRSALKKIKNIFERTLR